MAPARRMATSTVAPPAAGWTRTAALAPAQGPAGAAWAGAAGGLRGGGGSVAARCRRTRPSRRPRALPCTPHERTAIACSRLGIIAQGNDIAIKPRAGDAVDHDKLAWLGVRPEGGLACQ